MRKISFIFLFILSINTLAAQEDAVQFIDFSNIQGNGILLNEGWKFKAGDNPDYALPNFDDSEWDAINPTLDIFDLPQMRNTPIGWLRLHLHVDSTLFNNPLAFQIRQFIASEIFLNGNQVKKYGVVSNNPLNVEAFQPQYEPFVIQFLGTKQVVAVRFSFPSHLHYFSSPFPFNGFMLRFASLEGSFAFIKFDMRYDRIDYLEAGIFLLLFLIHLSFFIVYPKQRANLFFALSTLFVTIGKILVVNNRYNHDVAFFTQVDAVSNIFLLSLDGLFLFLAVHTLFTSRKGWSFWFVIAFFPTGIILYFLSHNWGFIMGMLIPLLISTAEVSRVSLLAYRNGKRGAGIVVTGLAGFFIFFSIYFLIYFELISFGFTIGDGFASDFLFYHLSAFSIPISLSLYLTLQYAYTTKDLEVKLIEVRELSEKSITQEQEKKQILASQKETLEKQVSHRTIELQHSLENLKSTQAQLIHSEKMASLGQLTAGIAHEIQNPLNFVNNFSEVSAELMEELKGERLKAKGERDETVEDEIIGDVIQNLEKITLHGKRADAIVKGMLEHSKRGSGQKEPTDINALADEFIRLSYQSFLAKDANFKVELKTSLDPDLPKITVIPQDIGKVLLNLYSNAFYACSSRPAEGEKPTVIVSTKNLGDKIQIAVTDNGPGIPDSIKDKIFQPFFTTKPTGEGTGLGLSLSYDIVKAHGGEIRVKSEEGKGSTFNIKLPLN